MVLTGAESGSICAFLGWRLLVQGIRQQFGRGLQWRYTTLAPLDLPLALVLALALALSWTPRKGPVYCLSRLMTARHGTLRIHDFDPCLHVPAN